MNIFENRKTLKDEVIPGSMMFLELEAKISNRISLLQYIDAQPIELTKGSVIGNIVSNINL
jgi:hypothetical protein